jgi:hypothetical protein
MVISLLSRIPYCLNLFNNSVVKIQNRWEYNNYQCYQKTKSSFHLIENNVGPFREENPRLNLLLYPFLIKNQEKHQKDPATILQYNDLNSQIRTTICNTIIQNF